jgi:hypothetical protein
MTQVSEMTERRQKLQQLRVRWGVKVAMILLRNPGALKKLMVMSPNEERYVRPPRGYELPAYRQAMKYCKSNEKYLRPTRWCNPRDPLVVAITNELGAYELSDWEFADAAFRWIKTNIEFEMLPMDSVSATLRRGTGTCLHAISLWIALCRAAEIKARYKEYKTMLNDVAIDLHAAEIMGLIEAEEAMIPDVLDLDTSKSQGEAYIDDKWIVADVGDRPEFYAQAGVPIPKLGEDAIDSSIKPIPGTIKHFESVPLMVGLTIRLGCWLVPVVMERASIIHAAPLGRKIIEEAGGIEAYDREARRKRELLSAETITEKIMRLTEDAKRKQVLVFEE